MRRMYTRAQIEKIVEQKGGSLTPKKLLEILEGSNTVVVDLNEDGDGVVVKLDQDVVDEIDGKLDATKEAVSTVGGLVVPTASLTDNVLVGLAQNKSQLNIYLGDGLDYDSTEHLLSVKLYKHKITGFIEPKDAEWGAGNDLWFSYEVYSSIAEPFDDFPDGSFSCIGDDAVNGVYPMINGRVIDGAPSATVCYKFQVSTVIDSYDLNFIQFDDDTVEVM